MSQASPSPLFEYAGMLWRRKILIAIITLALTAPALAFSLLQTPQYQASSALALSSPPTSDQSINSTALSDTEMTTEAAIVKGDAVEAAASAKGAGPAISTSLSAKSNIMTLTGTGATPQAAADTTNAYAEAYIDLRVRDQQRVYDQASEQLQSRIGALRGQLGPLAAGDGSQAGQLTTLESQMARIELQRSLAESSVVVVVRAVPPASASSPQILRNTAVGVVLGLALGIAVALLLGSAQRRPASLRDDADERRAAGENAGPVEALPERALAGSVMPARTAPPDGRQGGRDDLLDSPTVRTERPVGPDNPFGPKRRPLPVPEHRVNGSSNEPPKDAQVGGSGSGPSPRPR